MRFFFAGKPNAHLTGWIVLICFELFLVSYYTGFTVKISVAAGHYALSVLLFYIHSWFLAHKHISRKRSQLSKSATVIFLEGVVYVLLNTRMFEAFEYDGFLMQLPLHSNALVAFGICRSIFFILSSTGCWLLLWKIEHERDILCSRLPDNDDQIINLKEPENLSYMYINPGVKGKVIKVNFADIYYVEGLKNYIMIYTQETRYTTCLSLKEMESTLPPEKFFRIHKSFIVNTDRIKSLEGNVVLLSDGYQVPIGGGYRSSFLEHIDNCTVRREKV